MIWEPFVRTDQFFQWRVFTPVGHYIDYRFHYNIYRQAAVALTISMVMLLIGMTQYFLDNWKIGLIDLLCLPPWLWVWHVESVKLQKCSKLYENRPHEGLIPREAMYYQWLPTSRLFFVYMGAMLVVIALLPPHNHHFWIHDITSPWMLFYAACRYLAGIWPPSKARKKKKERTPMAAPLLQPST